MKMGDLIDIADATSLPEFLDPKANHPLVYSLKTHEYPAGPDGNKVPAHHWLNWSDGDWTVIQFIRLPADHPYYETIDWTKPVEVYNDNGYSAPATVTETYADGSGRVHIAHGQQLCDGYLVFDRNGNWLYTPPSPKNTRASKCKVRNTTEYVWVRELSNGLLAIHGSTPSKTGENDYRVEKQKLLDFIKENAS